MNRYKEWSESSMSKVEDGPQYMGIHDGLSEVSDSPVLNTLVRKTYFNYMKTILLENSTSLNLNMSDKDITKFTQEIELNALKTCMSSMVYRYVMLSEIGHVKYLTNAKVAFTKKKLIEADEVTESTDGLSLFLQHYASHTGMHCPHSIFERSYTEGKPAEPPTSVQEPVEEITIKSEPMEENDQLSIIPPQGEQNIDPVYHLLAPVKSDPIWDKENDQRPPDSHPELPEQKIRPFLGLEKNIITPVSSHINQEQNIEPVPEIDSSRPRSINQKLNNGPIELIAPVNQEQNSGPIRGLVAPPLPPFIQEQHYDQIRDLVTSALPSVVQEINPGPVKQEQPFGQIRGLVAPVKQEQPFGQIRGLVAPVNQEQYNVPIRGIVSPVPQHFNQDQNAGHINGLGQEIEREEMDVDDLLDGIIIESSPECITADSSQDSTTTSESEDKYNKVLKEMSQMFAVEDATSCSSTNAELTVPPSPASIISTDQYFPHGDRNFWFLELEMNNFRFQQIVLSMHELNKLKYKAVNKQIKKIFGSDGSPVMESSPVALKKVTKVCKERITWHVKKSLGVYYKKKRFRSADEFRILAKNIVTSLIEIDPFMEYKIIYKAINKIFAKKDVRVQNIRHIQHIASKVVWYVSEFSKRSGNNGR